MIDWVSMTTDENNKYGGRRAGNCPNTEYYLVDNPYRYKKVEA